MSKIPFIYILSQRYSGSTLLSFLLGTHPDISTIGERRKFYVHAIEKKDGKPLKCSCGAPFPECEYWNTVKNGLLKKFDFNDLNNNPTEFKFSSNKYSHRVALELFKSSLKLNTGLLRRPLKPQLDLFESFNSALVEETLKLSDAKVFLDSSKVIDHVLFLSLIKSFDIKVVWLTRDPRAQVNSAIKYNSWSIEYAANYWKQEMEENKYWLEKLNLNYVSLNYEALCHDPAGEMNRLLHFLKLDPSGFSLNFREKTQHIMGNYNMRMGSGSEISERKEWKTELTSAQIQTIEKLTQDYRDYYSKSV